MKIKCPECKKESTLSKWKKIDLNTSWSDCDCWSHQGIECPKCGEITESTHEVYASKIIDLVWEYQKPIQKEEEV